MLNAYKRRAFFDGIISLVEGMSNIFSSGIFNSSLSYEEMFGTDEELLASDWQAVGDDLRISMKHSRDEILKR